MAGREYNYTRGNNAIAPNRKYNPIEEERRVQRKRVTEQKKVKTYKITKIKGIVGISWLIFLLGGLTVGSYGKLYELQKELITTNSDISTLEAENEALRVDLLKYYSIHGIKEVALEKEMVLPAKSETIEVKWSKDYFKDIPQ